MWRVTGQASAEQPPLPGEAARLIKNNFFKKTARSIKIYIAILEKKEHFNIYQTRSMTQIWFHTNIQIKLFWGSIKEFAIQ